MIPGIHVLASPAQRVEQLPGSLVICVSKDVYEVKGLLVDLQAAG
jgi:hypothetical protein